MNNYEPGTYTDMNGTLFFGYTAKSADVVERAGDGSELVETSEIAANELMAARQKACDAATKSYATDEDNVTAMAAEFTISSGAQSSP